MTFQKLKQWFQQFKQWLFNNLWFGEQHGRTPFYRAMREAGYVIPLVMPNGTKIFGIDISHWNVPPVNLQRMKDNYGLQFVIIKGCDGTLKSNYFDQHKAAAKAAGLPFGIYCWLYPNNKVSIDAQTTAWNNLAALDYPPMGVFIDAEWTRYGGVAANPSAADLRMAHDRFMAKSGKAATTYTAPGYANTYLVGFDWSREELWVAHYGVTNPQLPSGATRYTIHQFTSTLDGHQLDPNGNAELDGNYWHGTQAEFNARYGVTPPPPPPAEDVITLPHDGMQRISGVRNGWKFELFIIDPSKCEYAVTCSQVLETVSDAAARTGATLAVNGGEWDRVSKPTDYTVSNGAVKILRNLPRPSLVVKSDTSVGIYHQNTENVTNAITGLRYLVQNGVIESYLDGTEPQYIEGHARSIHGVTADGHHIIMQSEGAYPNQGLTLKQSALIVQQYGAVTAFDSGGGGDVTCVLDGQSLIVPENVTNGVHFERPLPSVLLIKSKGTNIMAKNRVTVTWDQGCREREKPRISTADVTNLVLADNSVHYSDFDVVPDMDDPTNIKKRWIQLQSGWFIAVLYPDSTGLAKPRATVEPIAPPAGLPDLPISFTAGDDVTYVKQTVTIVLKAVV